MSLTCGVDVGGTKIAGAVVDEDGTILEHRRVDSPATDASAVEDAIADLVLGLAGEYTLAGVGIGAAGYVDADRAVVMFAPNVAWRDENLRDEIRARVDLPVVIENDANAAAWGEFTYGAAADVDDMLLVTVGTGVGGGLVHDGELYRGAFGAAGEIGHLRMVPGGRRCGCGNRGCLEQYASGTALVTVTRELAADGTGDTDGGGGLVGAGPAGLLARVGGDVAAVDGELITAAAREGDPFAVARIGEVGRWLGEAVASLAAVLDPRVVVVGGGVSDAGELLMEPVRDAFVSQLSGRGYRPTLEVRTASLGTRAGVLGAADLARR